MTRNSLRCFFPNSSLSLRIQNNMDQNLRESKITSQKHQVSFLEEVEIVGILFEDRSSEWMQMSTDRHRFHRRIRTLSPILSHVLIKKTVEMNKQKL